MAKKVEEKKPTLEREYIIPLRAKCRVAVRYKKTNKAVRTTKEFIAKHMKVENRDLSKVKLDGFLNNYLWLNGIKNPPHKVKVKATKKENGDVLVELVDFPKKISQRKARLEKRSEKGEVQQKKVVKPESEKPVESEEEKTDEKEKKESVKEASRALGEAQHKQAKHQTGGKMKAKTQPVRKALAK